MTRPDVEAIRERLDGITSPVPWSSAGYGDLVDSRGRQVVAADDSPYIHVSEQDANFIAHAPTDLRALLDYVEALERRESDAA